MAIQNITDYSGYTENPASPVFDAYAVRVTPEVPYLRPKFSLVLGTNSDVTLLGGILAARDLADADATKSTLTLDYSLFVAGSVNYYDYTAPTKTVYQITAVGLATNGSNPSQTAALRSYRFSGRDIDDSAKRHYQAYGANVNDRATDLFNQMANDPSFDVTVNAAVVTATEKVAGSLALIDAPLGFNVVKTVDGAPAIGTGQIAKAMGVQGASRLADTAQLSFAVAKYRLPATFVNSGEQNQGTPGHMAYGFEEVYVVIFAETAGATAFGKLKDIFQGAHTPLLDYVAVKYVAP